MSEQTLTPAQDALHYYKRYRKLYPLPAGWAEEVHRQTGSGATSERNVIYLENAEYVLELCLDDTEIHFGKFDLRVIRKDRLPPNKEEAVALAEMLLGVDDAIPYMYEALYKCSPASRPIRYLARPEPDRAPDEHYALKSCLRYPPDPCPPLTPAQEAQLHYLEYREAHPLPFDWTETVCGDVRPGCSTLAFRVLLENDSHYLELQFLDCHEPGDAYAYVVRKDGGLEGEAEAASLVAELLGEETDPRPYALVTVQFGADGRPDGYHLAEPPFDAPRDGEHPAQELRVYYPPEQ